jgi:transcription initiation factor IIE alpha subunit
LEEGTVNVWIVEFRVLSCHRGGSRQDWKPLTLQYSQSHGRKIIDATAVKEAVTVERLVVDMESELVEVFPKQSDLRIQAVKLLMFLEESGPCRQAKLAEELGMEGYAVSRLLDKLEHRYIIRRREGTDKIVSLWKKE